MGPTDGALPADLAFWSEALTQVGLPGQVVVLTLLLGCGIWTAVRAGALPVIALSACTALWLRADSQLEGLVLISLTPGRGVTLADLLVPAVGCVVLLHRHSAKPEPAPDEIVGGTT